MRCRKVQERLPAYLGHSLGWLAARAMAGHLRACEDCRAEMQAYERTAALLRDLGGERIPRDVTASVMACVAQESMRAPRPRRVRPVVLVPAAVTAAAALMIQISLHRPAPHRAEAARPSDAYIQEYAQFRASQEIGDGTGTLLLASELTEGKR